MPAVAPDPLLAAFQPPPAAKPPGNAGRATGEFATLLDTPETPPPPPPARDGRSEVRNARNNDAPRPDRRAGDSAPAKRGREAVRQEETKAPQAETARDDGPANATDPATGPAKPEDPADAATPAAADATANAPLPAPAAALPEVAADATVPAAAPEPAPAPAAPGDDIPAPARPAALQPGETPDLPAPAAAVPGETKVADTSTARPAGVPASGIPGLVPADAEPEQPAAAQDAAETDRKAAAGADAEESVKVATPEPQGPRLPGAFAAVRAGLEAVQSLGNAAPSHFTPMTAVQTAHAAALAAPAASAAATQPMPVPMAGVAVEIATQALTGKSRFEIRLDPPELGRIDVRLDVDKDGNVTSRLTVERAETLDLLRRDAQQLERALQQAGLKTSDNALQFSLRDQNAGRDEKPSHQGQGQAGPDEQDAPPDIAHRRGSLRLGGLDISI